jgi:transposase InsO family protein
MNDRNDQEWAVFWCTVLGPLLLQREIEPPRERSFRELSGQEFLCPDGKLRKFSARTLRRKYHRIVKNGIQALKRKPRSDRGKVRKNRDSALNRAVELKRNQPLRSDRVINEILKAERKEPIPRSTLYRHLKQRDATRALLGYKEVKVRCRWTRDHSNAMWVGDFEHGPPVLVNDNPRSTRLSAWIDCYSRYIVDARYYLNENLDVLIDSLLRAWSRSGASRELYVDNAKVYHSKALRLACTQLNIQLLHRPPRDPPAGGLVERFFKTVQSQLEPEVRAQKSLLTLDALNGHLQAWLRVSYHQQPNSDTKVAPQKRYAEGTKFTRQVNLHEIADMFAVHEERTIDPDFVDVRINNVFYAVDPALGKRKVIVRYDPFSDLREVEIFSPDGRYLGVGRRHERGPRGDAHPLPKSQPEAGPDYLNALAVLDAEATQKEVASGIDYRTAQKRCVWSVSSFAAKLAKLLGRKGAVSSFSVAELKVMHATLQRFPELNEASLQEAFARCNSGTLPAITEVLFHVQALLSERSS